MPILHFTLADSAVSRLVGAPSPLANVEKSRVQWKSWKNTPRNTSAKERRAVAAERDVTQLMGCFIARKHLGESMTVTVMGVHDVGAFVRANELCRGPFAH